MSLEERLSCGCPGDAMNDNSVRAFGSVRTSLCCGVGVVPLSDFFDDVGVLSSGRRETSAVGFSVI